MAFRNYILLFALVAGTIAGPMRFNVQDGETKCAKTCTESLSNSAKFRYTPGNTYVYNYEGTTETKLNGASPQTTTLKIKAQANIEAISTCEFALKLSEVSLAENGQTSSGNSDFKRSLEANTLRFSFQDGTIEDICSVTGEDERVLNIKRGILSTFQNTMAVLDKDGIFTETDISGTCPTTYKAEAGMFGESGMFGGLTITKTKDMLACTNRNGNMTSIHAKAYNVPSKFQNAPLLKTTHQCQQQIKSGQIEKTTCTEELMFRPFNKEGSGAVTTATQTLTYKTRRSSVSTSEAPVQRRSSLLFEHVYDESIDSEAKTQVIATLQTICSEVSDEITKDTPALFATLVSHMKRLSTDKMMQVYTAVNGGRICSSTRGKQFFFDAIPMVATEASLSMMQKLISDKIVQGVEAEAWLTQLAFIPRPTYEMLSAIKPLVNDETYRNRSLLGVSAMVHKICELNSDCQRNSDVADFVSMLSNNIGSTCSSQTTEQRNLILITLKAFGNAGNAMTSSSVVRKCINSQEVDMEIRVAALQALRLMPCSVDREDAMTLFQNADNDAELRIHAFMAVMACPSDDLSKIRMMLSAEPVNQVGSFVWTYLENMRETSVPLKRELASILQDAKLREDFNCDVRKFSRNIEKSLFSAYLNMGAQVESNLIWSQRSYLPRSAMVNVSLELFGNSINLLEVGGRVQGLERLVEKFLGPDGYFTKKETKELMDNKRQTAANYASPFDRTFKTPEDKMTTSMYVKMFGNEIAFKELNNEDWSELQHYNLLDLLIRMSEPRKIDITKNYQFMDSSIIIPTIIGLPMNLTVNGTASVSLDMNGNADLRNMAASPRSMNINGHLKPSAAVVVSGIMGVDAIVAKSTMKMVATMHTSTSIDGKIQLQDGKIFNMEFNTPQEKMEVFHVQTEFFMNGREMNMPAAAEVDYKKCSSPQITKILGMEMCVDVKLPKMHQAGLPLAPFTGPMNAQVFIEKKDTHTGYTFLAKMLNDREQVEGKIYTKRTMHVSLDTPGSTVDRKILAEVIYDPSKMTATADLQTPWKKMSWETSLTNTEEMKRAFTKMTMDNNQEYSVDAKLEINEKSVKTVYTPSLTVVMPNKPPMTASGVFEYGTGKTMMAMNARVEKFTRKPIVLSSSLNKFKGGESYNFEMSLQSDYLTTKVESQVSGTNNIYQGRASLEYSYENRPTHRFTTSGKFADNSLGDLKSYSVQAGFIPTEYPQYSFTFDGDFQATQNHVSTKVDLELNKDKIAFEHKTTKQGDLKALTVESTTSLTYPQKNINFNSELKHQHDQNMIKSSGFAVYNGKRGSASVDLKRTDNENFGGEATLSYPGRDMKLESNVNKLGDGERKLYLNAEWGSQANQKMTMSTSWKAGEIHEITGDVKVPGYPVSFKLSMKPNFNDFMARADVTYRRDTWSVMGEYKLQGQTLTTSAKYICPTRTVTYDMTLMANSNKATLSSDLKWDAENDQTRALVISAEYNKKDRTMFNRDMTLTVVSPMGTYSVRGELERTGDYMGNFKVEYNKRGTSHMINGRVAENEGELTINSPWIQYESVRTIYMRYNKFQNSIEGELSWNPTDKITGTVKITENQYEIELNTPFKMAKSVLLTATLPRESGRFEVQGHVDSNTMSLSVDYPRFSEGRFEMTYNNREMVASFTQNGKIENFSGEADLTWDQKKMSGKINWDVRGPMILNVDIKTPFKYQKLSANLKHEGQPMDFKSQALLTLNSDKVKTTLTFNGKSAEIIVKSPWRNMNAKYEVTGDRKSFTGYALVNWGENQEVRGDLTYSWTGRQMTASGKFMSPWTSFTVSAEHTGNMEQWNNKAEISVDGMDKMTVYSEYDGTKFYTGKVGMTNIPLRDFQSFVANFEHRVYSNSFNTVAGLTYNGDKTYTGALNMNKKNGYSLTASMNTPYTNEYSLEVKHDGDSMNFENTATVQWAPSKKITAITTLHTRNGFDAKIRVDSPWRQMSASATKQGNSDEFTASTIVSWESGKQIKSALEFSKVGTIQATWTLETPFEQLRDASLKLNHQGNSYEKFYSQVEGKINGKDARIAVNWDMTNNVELTVVSANPWKSFNAKMNYNGKPTDYATVTLFYGIESTERCCAWHIYTPD